MARFHQSFILLSVLSLIFFSCSREQSDNVVDVTAKNYYFTTKDSIPAGWTTFRFNNEGKEVHFFFLTELPEGISFQQYLGDVSKPFDITLDSLEAGMAKPEAGTLLGSLLPQWYASAKVMGGTGLTSPGKTSQTTIKLEPGIYVMECYVKTEEGKFHSSLGMIRPVTVTDNISENKEPDDTNVDLTVSNSGIESSGNVQSGTNRVAVHFKEHPQYGLGNDIHVVKLTDKTNIDSIIHWMDWMNLSGLRSPAPAEFLGGTQEMPVGYTSYFTVKLEPGKYAWISETTKDSNMVKEFSVE